MLILADKRIPVEAKNHLPAMVKSSLFHRRNHLPGHLLPSRYLFLSGEWATHRSAQCA